MLVGAEEEEEEEVGVLCTIPQASLTHLLCISAPLIAACMSRQPRAEGGVSGR